MYRGEKRFKLMWRCHKFLSGFLAKDHLPRVSRQSRFSSNDKDDNDLIQRTVHRSPGVYVMAEEKPRKTSTRRSSDEGCTMVIASNEVPYLQIKSVGSHRTS